MKAFFKFVVAVWVLAAHAIVISGAFYKYAQQLMLGWEKKRVQMEFQLDAHKTAVRAKYKVVEGGRPGSVRTVTPIEEVEEDDEVDEVEEAPKQITNRPSGPDRDWFGGRPITRQSADQERRDYGSRPGSTTSDSPFGKK